MDYYRKRDRRRILDDLIEIQREEDAQRLSMRYHFKDSDDDEYTKYHQRRKEYCLVKATYRNSNNRRRRKFDEVMVIHNHQIVFKGCVQDTDQFTFKSPRYVNESRVKLKFYINDLFEDEIIACCTHGLIDRNRPKHLFQIEEVIGAKPCYDCEFDGNLLRTTNNSVLSSSTTEQKPKETKSSLNIPQTETRKASSEGFPADINEFSEYHKPPRNQHESDDDSTDTVPSIHPPPPKRSYGPPQLSTMLSVTDSLDTPSLNTRRSNASGFLFNSASSNQQQQQGREGGVSQLNQNETNASIQTPEYLSPQLSHTETIPSEPGTSLNVNNSNEIAIAQDATQLLLTRLGIIRQEQVERPETFNSLPPREKGNVEYFTLVYLHESEPDESVIKHLRSLVNFLKIFNDTDDCIAFINTVVNEKIVFILSHTFQESILSRIGDLPQIYTIYILSEDEIEDKSSSHQSKIQGFYTDINAIYSQIEKDITKISRDLIIYLNVSSTATTIDPTIVFFLLLTEIILGKTDEKTGMKDLITFSRQEYEGNEIELKIIDEFESTYQKNQAIYWYSRPCFLSKILNKALRIPEPDILYYFRVYIRDLFHQIENESTSEVTTVYLGQTIERNNLEELQTNLLTSDLIILPQFLFGSTDQERAIQIARQLPLTNENFLPLIIRLDISEGFKCVNLNSRRYSIDEDNNVLLNMNTLSRLIKIEKDNPIAIVHLRVIKSENQQNLQEILEITRKEVKSITPLVNLIKLMIKMNQQPLAEQMIQKAFNDETIEEDAHLQGSIATASHLLAQSRRDQEDYKNALEFYLISLHAFHRIMPSNSIELSILNSSIGSMYFRLDNFEKSYEHYSKALEIQLHSNTPDLFSVSSFTNSIGIIYSKQGKYPEAIKSFERTIKILQQCPEAHDAELLTAYDSIGDAYLLQQKYDDALENYSKALEIQERLEPRDPLSLGTSYHTIGNLYLKFGRSKEALQHLKQSLEYFLQVLPVTHSTFPLLYNNIGLMYYREEQYEEALKCYSKTLEIAAISLPENHSLVGITLFNIGLVYSSEGKLDEAIEIMEKSTEQFLKTLPEDHPDILDNKKYIEAIRQKKVLKGIFDEDTASF